MYPSENAAPNNMQAQTLIAEAFGHMKAEHWDEATRLLEAAIAVAPENLRAPALEVLASICVSKNQHVRLRELMGQHVPVAPQMITGALLLARNHALGIDGELPTTCDREHVEGTLRRLIDTRSYQPGELLIVLALLAQLGWAETVLDVALLCVEADIDLEPGLIETVLAMLVRAGKRDSAFRLLDALRGRRDASRYPIRRWARLLRADPAEPQDQVLLASDKVVRFLHLVAAN